MKERKKERKKRRRRRRRRRRRIGRRRSRRRRRRDIQIRREEILSLKTDNRNLKTMLNLGIPEVELEVVGQKRLIVWSTSRGKKRPRYQLGELLVARCGGSSRIEVIVNNNNPFLEKRLCCTLPELLRVCR